MNIHHGGTSPHRPHAGCSLSSNSHREGGWGKKEARVRNEKEEKDTNEGEGLVLKDAWTTSERQCGKGATGRKIGMRMQEERKSGGGKRDWFGKITRQRRRRERCRCLRRWEESEHEKRRERLRGGDRDRLGRTAKLKDGFGIFQPRPY